MLPAKWENENTIEDWWTKIALLRRRKESYGLHLFLGKFGSNARFFRHHSSSMAIVINKIKEEAMAWSLARW
jgi:hypothetical protein